MTYEPVSHPIVPGSEEERVYEGIGCTCICKEALNEQLAYKRGVAGPKKWRPEVI